MPAGQTQKPSEQLQPETQRLKGTTPNHFPIVGIGASAGGLEAFTELLTNLPLDTGLGFVLVQHLDPQHESALTRLLTRATSMPVLEVTNNLRVEANHIYVIPPNTNLTIEQGILKLRPRQKTRTPIRSIDSFFESLAQEQRELAIGVILSGTATDGTAGLETIKAEGGITFAQDESARYDSMPRSAIEAGCVDFVLKPKDIAKELAHIAKHPYVTDRPHAIISKEDDQACATGHQGDETPLPSGGHGTPQTGAKGARGKAGRGGAKAGENGFQKIILLLRDHSGVDFSFYKSTTIQRRITRRMALNKQHTPEGYAAFLRGNGKELDDLYSDVLISVTSFFRSPEAFKVLKQKVFPKLLQQRGDDPLRVWVLGCSTGQEAYSIAMAFVESAESAPRARKLQVFATDLNDAMLEKARRGLYTKSLAQDVSAERLRRFFVEEEGGYRVVKPLREMVLFARQNLISDPPFSRMDLISCRNLLIYLEPSLQKKAMPTFHYALKPEGFLLLGASESIGGFTDLFKPMDKKHKIYLKTVAPAQAIHLPVKKEPREPSPGPRATLPIGKEKGEPLEGFRAELNAQREADRVTVNQYAPPGVLINTELQILQFRGTTSPYFQLPTGKASFDVLKMAREGLMLPLRAAINKAKKEHKTARKENVRLQQNGKTRAITVEVIPLKNLRERCFLILFEDFEEAGRAIPAPSSKQSRGDLKTASPVSKKEESRRVSKLETELSETRDYLQSIQEQHESANEELQAFSEEVQSANEELQSINEELETSTEELESANEELTTVNEEMANRTAELNRLNADLSNLQASTKLPIVLLGRDLIMQRFSALAERIFNLLATDVGRPLSGIRHNLVVPEEARVIPSAPRTANDPRSRGEDAAAYPVEDLVREVIDTVREQEREVRDRDGRWYSLRVRPYMTLDNKVDGAVLVLVDITELKRTEREIKAARDYAEATIRTARDAMVILHADLRVNTANEAFYKIFKTTRDQTDGRLIYDLGNQQWNIPKIRILLEDILPQHSFFNDFEITHDFPHIGRRTMLLNARQLERDDSAPPMILLAIEDVTERQRLDELVRMSEIRYRSLFEAAHDGVLILDSVSGKITEANPFIAKLLGYTRENLVGKELWQIGLLKDEQASHVAFRELQQRGQFDYEGLRLESKSGEQREVEVVGTGYEEDGKQFIQCNIRDITGRKQAEEALRASEERYRTLFDLGPVAVCSCDASGVIQQFNRRAAELWGREPAAGDTDERFCGSFKLFRPDGSFMPHEQCPMAEVIAGKIPAVHDAEVLIERPDSSRVTVVVNICPLMTERGKITGAINCFYDITQRKEAERAGAALATIVEYSDDAIISKDLNGIITSWNGGAERIFGYRAEEMIGQSIMRIIPPDRKEEEKQILMRLQRGQRVDHFDTVRVRRDNRPIDVSLTISPIRDSKGIVIGASKIARDITERKRIEQDRHEFSRELEKQVHKRTVELEEANRALLKDMEERQKLEQQFHQSQKLESVGVLASGVAHDLNNLLNIIQGYASLIGPGAPSKEIEESIDAITETTQRGAALVQQLLALARKTEFKKESLDINTLIQRLRGLIKDTFPKTIETTLDLAPVLPMILADANQINQVLLNLCINAHDAMPDGGTLSLGTSIVAGKKLEVIGGLHAEEYVSIDITDTGIGMDQNVQSRIFEPFFTTKDIGKGTGLGLAVVYGIMKSHNGFVDVTSHPMRGTTFRLYFPTMGPEG